MKKTLFSIFSILLLFSCTEDRTIPSDQIVIDPSSVLIHYWNFNALDTGTLTSISPDFTLLSTANPTITYEGTSTGYMDSFSPGYSTNAQNSDLAGSGLRARNPSDTRYLLFSIPTTGYQKIIVQFATAKSSASGAAQQNYSYTVDGVNYITDGLNILTHNLDIDPLNALVSLDFTAITAASNNPNFKLKIEFAGDTASGTSGNNRFDNITVLGVNAPPSNLGYTATNNFTLNAPIVPLNPTVNGNVTSYAISPALPSGLSLNTTTGIISGTPTQLSSATNYTITASNSSGSTTFTISIAVSAVVDNTLYLIHYWNFNSLPTGTLTTINTDSSLITSSTSTITYPGTGAGYMDQVSPGSSLNTQNSAIDGLGLRVRNPSDTRSLIIAASTSGYKNIVVKFAIDRTSSGATVQNYSYTIDGINYITTGLSTTTFSPSLDPTYDIITLDFSSISTVANNPNFKIKIDFAGANASGASGNNRFDNITFQGNIL
jgi:heat shock protein HslJ